MPRSNRIGGPSLRATAEQHHTRAPARAMLPSGLARRSGLSSEMPSWAGQQQTEVPAASKRNTPGHAGAYRGLWSVAACAAAVITMSGTASAQSVAAPSACPSLYVLGVQGTSESGPAADPLALTGMIGHIFGPMLAQSAGGSIAHATIPYPAAFGGAPGTGPSSESFAESATQAGEGLASAASTVVAQCPHTKLAVVGFSQGAGEVADFSRRVGAGLGPVPPDRIAAVALLSDWTRAPGGDQIPGRPGQVSPDAPPGSDAAVTSRIRIAAVPSTSGLGSETDDFGALTGRVAEFCTPGDLSCDAPPHAELLRTGAEVAAQADLRDPISAVQSLGAAAQATAAKASAAVALNDIHVDSGQVNYVPRESFSHRLTDAADPRAPIPSLQQQQQVSDNLGRAAAAVIADPLGQIPRLAVQISSAIAANLADNVDLANPATLARYGDLVNQHTGYASTGATQQVADWFASLARPQAGAHQR